MVESSRYRYNCTVDYHVRVTSTDEIAIRILAFVLNNVAAVEINALLISGEINCGRCNCIEIKREELLQM